MDRFALFPTPLFVYDVPNVEDMNCELGERLRAEAQASPSVRRANVGGWHSPPDPIERYAAHCRRDYRLPRHLAFQGLRCDRDQLTETSHRNGSAVNGARVFR